MKLSRTFWDPLEHYRTFWDPLEHYRTFLDPLEHYRTFWDPLEHYRIFWDPRTPRHNILSTNFTSDPPGWFKDFVESYPSDYGENLKQDLLPIEMNLVDILFIPIKNHLALIGILIIIPGPGTITNLAICCKVIKPVHGCKTNHFTFLVLILKLINLRKFPMKWFEWNLK